MSPALVVAEVDPWSLELPADLDRRTVARAVYETREGLARAGVRVLSELLVDPAGPLRRTAATRVRFEVEAPSGRNGVVGLALGARSTSLSDYYSSDLAPDAATTRPVLADPRRADVWALLRAGGDSDVGPDPATNAEYAALVDLANDLVVRERALDVLADHYRAHPDPDRHVEERRFVSAVRLGEVDRWTVEAATALLSGDPVEWVHRVLRRGTGAPA